MPVIPASNNSKVAYIQLCRNRRKIWIGSGLALIVSFLGFLISFLNPSISAPLRPGLDFTGGTQIQLERICDDYCSEIEPSKITSTLEEISLSNDNGRKAPNLAQAKVQLLDESKLLVIRLPFLSAAEGKQVIQTMETIFGPFQSGGQEISTIGPKLGKKLFKSSFISLLVAFAGISLYISIRYDRRYAFLALIALAHDVIIVCGIFAWLGILIGLEVDSLFAVALLTIAGYSVNDTVVVFDRIREFNNILDKSTLSDQIDNAVSATLTRTIYTTGTTLLPLIALIFFGGKTLYWFAIALACGLLVGSWSSIALAPSLLSINENKKKIVLIDQDEGN